MLYGSARATFSVHVGADSEEQRDLPLDLEAVADVPARRTPVDVGVQAVGRQRRRAVGEVLLLAERVAEAHPHLLLAHHVSELACSSVRRSLCERPVDSNCVMSPNAGFGRTPSTGALRFRERIVFRPRSI